MNRAPGSHFFVTEKNTGAILTNPEGVPPFNETTPHFPIRNLKMAGKTIYVGRIEKQGRTLQSIAAIPRAVVTKIPVAGKAVRLE